MLPADFSLVSYAGPVLAASVHTQKHEAEMVRFVKRNRAELEAMPTVLLSVSLSEAGAEDMSKSAEDGARAAADAQGLIQAFLDEAGWHPRHIRAVAGALLYSKIQFSGSVRDAQDLEQGGRAHPYVARLRVHRLGGVGPVSS